LSALQNLSYLYQQSTNDVRKGNWLLHAQTSSEKVYSVGRQGEGGMGEAVAAPFNKGGTTTFVEGVAKRDVVMDMVLVIVAKCR
jgi:hypothetical protein